MRGAHNVDPTILAILEPQDALARYNLMLDNPVQIATDQLTRPLGPHPCRNAQLVIDRTRCDLPRKGFNMRYTHSNLGKMKRGHNRHMGLLQAKTKPG